jgi:hypothetical protein
MRDDQKQTIRIKIDEKDDEFVFLTSPDMPDLLIVKVSREKALAAVPEAVRRCRFQATGTLSPLPELELIKI